MNENRTFKAKLVDSQPVLEIIEDSKPILEVSISSYLHLEEILMAASRSFNPTNLIGLDIDDISTKLSSGARLLSYSNNYKDFLKSYKTVLQDFNQKYSLAKAAIVSLQGSFSLTDANEILSSISDLNNDNDIIFTICNRDEAEPVYLDIWQKFD